MKKHKGRSKEWSLIKRRIAGSFTIEASLLMPFLLLIIFWVIYAAFYLHDQVVVKAELQRMLIQVTTVTDQESITYGHFTKAGEQQVVERLEKEIQERVLVGKQVTAEINRSGQKVTGTVICQLNIPFFWVKAMLGGGTLAWKEERRLQDPVDCVRKEYLVYTKINQTKIFEKIQENLEQIRKELE